MFVDMAALVQEQVLVFCIFLYIGCCALYTVWHENFYSLPLNH